MSTEKKKFLDAYAAVVQIENLLTTVADMLDRMPLAVQQEILNYHREPATLHFCTRWGLQAAKEIREDWAAVVANLPCVVEGANDG